MLKRFGLKWCLGVCLILALGMRIEEGRGDEFENALSKAQLLGASSAQFHSNLARVVVDNDPIAAAEYVAKVKEFRTAFEAPEALEDELQKNKEYIASVGITDPDWLIRVTGAVVHKDEARFWTFIQKISKEMLKRLPHFKSTREEVKNVFINRVIFELKFKFAHYLSNFNSIALSSKRQDVNQFGHFLEALQLKMEKEEKITAQDIGKLTLSLRELFLDYPLIYDDVAVYVELLEVYNSFQEARTGKPQKLNRPSLVGALRKAGEFSGANNQLIRTYIYRDAERINVADIEGIPLQIVRLILAQQNATVSGDQGALAAATFNTILEYLDVMGKKKLVEVSKEFMDGIPAGEFFQDQVSTKKKKQGQGRGKQKSKSGGKASKVKSNPKAKTKNTADSQKASQNVTAEATLSASTEQASQIVATQMEEVAVLRSSVQDNAAPLATVGGLSVVDLDSPAPGSDLPQSMQGELDGEGEFVSEADLNDYLKYHSRYQAAKKRHLMQVSAPKVDDVVPVREIRLSGLGAKVFQIASGQAFNEFQVGNRHFLDLLRQLRGGLIRGTGKGKGSARHYALPNLKDKAGKRPHNFYPIHFVHGGRDFNPKTLRALLGRDLEDAGYINNPSVRIVIE